MCNKENNCILGAWTACTCSAGPPGLTIISKLKSYTSFYISSVPSESKESSEIIECIIPNFIQDLPNLGIRMYQLFVKTVKTSTLKRDAKKRSRYLVLKTFEVLKM